MPNPQRYTMEITDVETGEIVLVSADWTAKERDLAISGVLRLVGMKAVAWAKRQGKAGSGGQAPRATPHGRLEAAGSLRMAVAKKPDTSTAQRERPWSVDVRAEKYRRQ